MRKFLTIVILSIMVSGCKKEEKLPSIEITLKSSGGEKRLEMYVGTEFEVNEYIVGGKSYSIEAKEKSYDVYYVYKAHSDLGDGLVVKGLNTDTIFKLIPMGSGSFTIK